MFDDVSRTAKIAEKTIYKEFRVHHDFDSHRSLRYINVYYTAGVT